MSRLSIIHLLRDSAWVALALLFAVLSSSPHGVAAPPLRDLLALAVVLLLCAATVEALEARGDEVSPGVGGTVLAVFAAAVVLVPLHFGTGLLLQRESLALWALLWFALLRGGCVLASSYWHVFPALVRGVLVLGNAEGIRRVTALVADADGRYRVKAVVQCPDPGAEAAERDADWLADLAHREGVRIIVVSLSERRGTFPLDAVLRCRLRGVRVLDAPTFYELVTRKLNIEGITPGWFIFAPGFGGARWEECARRLADIVLALLALFLVAPFLPVVALAISLDSPGPILFRQVRVGRGGKPFALYKFRTMRDGAERDTGPVWARVNDSRVTRLGGFLRRCRIDELPQLFNVLRGDMGFIGPRPERPEFVSELVREVPFYDQRHAVKPGLTGWAQVCFPYGASKSDALEKLRYDLYYIKNRTLMLDMEILARTFSVVLLGAGAR